MIFDWKRLVEVLPRALMVSGIAFAMLVLVQGLRDRTPPRWQGRASSIVLWIWLVALVVVLTGGVRW